MAWNMLCEPCYDAIVAFISKTQFTKSAGRGGVNP